MNINLIKLLLKLKNASNSRKEQVSVVSNKTYNIVLETLYQEGLIQSFSGLKSTALHSKALTNVFLRYPSNKSSFETFKAISTPSKLHYLTFSDLCQISDKKYILFLFTDKNLLTGNECKKHGLGGKLLFIC
jgi:ribosomal protein S8